MKIPVALPGPVRTLLQGFCIGTADIIPGVSGGTMALVLGIYQRLIHAIRAFDATCVRLLCRLDWLGLRQHLDLVFLLLLALGLGSAVLFFTRVVSLPELLITRTGQVYGLFFGLITGSILVLFFSLKGMRWLDLASLLAGCALGAGLIAATPAGTPETAWFVFCSGFLAICATLLPGISGSFVLLLLQKYAYIMQAIATFQLSVLVPFGLGVLAGLVLFSRLMLYLLRRHWQVTTCFMLGLLLASLWLLWPFRLPHGQGSSVVLLMLLGFVVVLALHWLARRSGLGAGGG